MLIGTPIAVAGILLAPVVIPFVLGDDYEPAAGLFQVLMVALLLVAVSGVMNNALIALGRTRTFAGIVVASLVVNVAVNLALLPTVGVVGAAIATVATEAFVLVLATIAVWTGMAAQYPRRRRPAGLIRLRRRRDHRPRRPTRPGSRGPSATTSSGPRWRGRRRGGRRAGPAPPPTA